MKSACWFYERALFRFIPRFCLVGFEVDSVTENLSDKSKCKCNRNAFQLKANRPLANRCMVPSTTWTCSNLFIWEAPPPHCEQTHRKTWLKTLSSRQLHIYGGGGGITAYFLLRGVPLTNLVWLRYYWHERSRISHHILGTFLRLV